MTFFSLRQLPFVMDSPAPNHTAVTNSTKSGMGMPAHQRFPT